jgi:poly(3-hydroxybutyrate) depolymerase
MNERGEHLGIYRSPACAAAVRQRHLELLDGWPVPCRLLSVPTREGETFVVAGGPEDAPPVVVLHGSGPNAAR